MKGLIKSILLLPIDNRNQLINQAGLICHKISRANIKKIVHKRPGPVAYHAKDDIKDFMKMLKHNLPEHNNLPDSPICQYNYIIKPLNKYLVNLSR